MQDTLFGADVLPRSSVTAKLPTYRSPAGAPLDEAEQQAYRDLVVDFVFIAWRKLRRAVSLQEIFGGVSVFKYGVEQERIVGVFERVQGRIDNGFWPYAGFPRGKRTVDRRVNEAAAPDFYSDNKARIAAVSPGIYQPSPEML